MLYSDFFNHILEDFKEDIEIHHKKISGTDEYGRPIYINDGIDIVKGIFEEGEINYNHENLKLDDVKNPKVYLPLNTQINRDDKLFIRGKQYAIVSIYKTNLQIEITLIEVKE